MPGADRYRISVKREPRGLASRHLHDRVAVGSVLMGRAPAGEFVLEAADGPVALISAGVGLTPVLSMLHALVAAGGEWPTGWLHGARDSAHHALADEVRAVAGRVGRVGRVRSHVRYSRPAPGDVRGADYDTPGRLDAEEVLRAVGADAAGYYLCGPLGFMAGIRKGLESARVPPERIHQEAFGPAA